MIGKFVALVLCVVTLVVFLPQAGKPAKVAPPPGDGRRAA